MASNKAALQSHIAFMKELRSTKMLEIAPDHNIAEAERHPAVLEINARIAEARMAITALENNPKDEAALNVLSALNAERAGQ